MTDKLSEKDREFVKGANENSVDVLIRRFKAGDPEVMYEKIQSSAELAVDSLDGDPRIAKYSISRLPAPHWSVEERLKPLNPFYQDKTKKKFIPTIETEEKNPNLNRQTSSERAAAEAKTLRETRAALKAAEKQLLITAIKKNSSEKAFRKHSANMPLSYNDFIAKQSKAYV
ncbi:hypothetical protein ACHWQZ_G005602 [Mnemiopsis leidyi]